MAYKGGGGGGVVAGSRAPQEPPGYAPEIAVSFRNC